MSDPIDPIVAERQRIQTEYERRERDLAKDFYAPWQPYELFMRFSRKKKAAEILHKAGVFPEAPSQCLEIGYGRLGWLGDLISWGVPESSLHGVELDASRAKIAQQLLPNADLRIGDATRLPWQNDSFQLVIASTVFTSILDHSIRQIVASEIARVMAPGGALLWYDFAVNNPSNPNVQRVSRPELRKLFPTLQGEIHSVTLAPPIARRIAGKSWVLATFLEALPFLRTHLIAVLTKPSLGETNP
jgi:SAM-dependent methyltransferase